MARVTVEDCIDKVPNRFDLVILAAHRAREISAGQPETVDRDNDKNPVVALREIADETQLTDDLRERAISIRQRYNEVDLPDDDHATASMLALSAPVPTDSGPLVIDDGPDEVDSEEALLRRIQEAQEAENNRLSETQ